MTISTPGRLRWTATCLALAGLLALAAPAEAQYIETLGPAQGVAVASGSDVVSAGTGLHVTGSGTIDLTIPAGASVEQVFLYWGGRDATDFDDTLVMDGAPVIGGPVNVVGSLIGQSGLPLPNPAFTYRADVTANLNLAPGLNQVDISGFDMTLFRRDGASLVAIIDDGSRSGTVFLHDGSDFAWFNSPSRGGDITTQTTVKQTFAFAAAGIDRTASLIFLVGDTDATRPDRLQIWVGANTVLNETNYFQQIAGPQWSDRREDVAVPAGETEISAQIFSEGPPGSNPESLTWNVFAAFVPAPPALGCTYTQGGYKNVRKHGDRWPLDWTDPFPYGTTGKSYLEILQTPVKGDPWMNLAHQYIAANNNYINNGSSAPPNVEAALTNAETLLSTYDAGAVPNSAKSDFIDTKDTLDSYNNGNEGVPHCDDVAGVDDDRLSANLQTAGGIEEGVSVFPNPLRGRATVQVTLAEAAHVRATVYDVTGRQVAVLSEGEMSAGSNPLALDASALAPGVYLYRVETPQAVWTGRMSVVR